MRKATFFIILCWATFGFLLYLGYSETLIDLPIEYAYLPMVLRTQESTIILLIFGLVLGLVSYAVVFPSNHNYYTKGVNDEVPPKLSKSIDSSVTKLENQIIRGKVRELGWTIIEGRIVYSHRYTQSPSMLEKRANEYTVEEAWAILRTDFWDTKRRNLKRFNPEIYEQIMYWEDHLDEYFVYMNMKLLFNIPYLESDFWVRRREI